MYPHKMCHKMAVHPQAMQVPKEAPHANAMHKAPAVSLYTKTNLSRKK